MAKYRVLMVDDEVNIINGFKRSMRNLGDGWEASFAMSGAEALTMMAEQRFDVVVSDMRMPEMSGAELLRKVSERFPGTIRFILSGYSDKGLILQAVSVAHRFIAKPCGAEKLEQYIKGSLGLRNLLASEKLHAIISKTQSLPSRPKVYEKLVAELQSEEASSITVAGLISDDIALTARILQLINSAFFGLPRRVENVLQAVNLLGMNTIHDLVLATGIFHEFTGHQSIISSVEMIFNHSLRVARLSKQIALEMGLSHIMAEDASTAGLLHDIGKLIELVELPGELQSSVELAKKEGIPLYEAEYKILGVCHAEIGAHLLSIWGIPDTIVEAVAYHHQPSKSHTIHPGPLTAVYLANMFDGEELHEHNLLTPGKLDHEYLSKVGMHDKIDHLRQVCITENIVKETEEVNDVSL